MVTYDKLLPVRVTVLTMTHRSRRNSEKISIRLKILAVKQPHTPKVLLSLPLSPLRDEGEAPSTVDLWLKKVICM